VSRDRISTSTTQRLGWTLKSWRYESLIRNCKCYASFISQDQKKHIIPTRNILWFLDPTSMFFLPFGVSLSQKSVILYFIIGFNTDLRSVSTHCTLSLSLSLFLSNRKQWRWCVLFRSAAMIWWTWVGCKALRYGARLRLWFKAVVCGNIESHSDPLKQRFSNWALQKSARGKMCM